MKKLSIKYSRNCWGDRSYFGMVDGKQYTEGYDTIEELKEEYQEFESIEAQ